ncbi:hypothetical protein OIU77_024556 [Salix suchowensis]|uniref:Stachyose synthase n=1 Tax=Salix suchowensis TaxID=1278906 RepID=A0ABQ9BUV5_9ROSI|nr:hypothetical protein OIU77_024556 [Salix suchowensis]
MKEAYSALRVHLNTFKLLEEKTAPSLVDKFGWCTWDAFYLTVEPAGVWHGVNDFVEGGVTPRFLIIDDGWQSINTDDGNPNEDAKNLVLGGTQMTARLHRLDDCEKFRKYKGASMLGPNPPSFDPKKPKMLISKAIEHEHAEKDREQAIQSGVTDLSPFEARIQKLKQELDTLFGGEEKSVSSGSYSCKAEGYGMKAFTGDLRTKFKGLDDIYVWHALCGAWGGVRPGSTNLNSKIISCKLSPGLDGTMTDLAVVKIVEGGIGLVHPDQAGNFYDSMHSYLSNAGITGVKVDVIHVRLFFTDTILSSYEGRVELAKFHAGSRAICGGPVYVSDSVGGHDFELLRKLVHPDGTITRCQDFALPTRDCLFRNPLFEKKTILKIWNFNKKKEAARMRRAEEFIVYLSQAEDLLHASPQSEAIQITIQPSSFEIFSFVPIKKLGTSIDFAPVGLTDMFNSGGTIQELEYFDSEAETRVKIEVKGGGNFLSYSTASPKKGFLNGAEVAFEWLDNGRLTLNFPWAETAGGISHVVFLF